MSKRGPPSALAAGLACVVLLLRSWRGGPAPAPPTPVKSTASEKATPSPPRNPALAPARDSLSPEAPAMLAALARAFAAGDVRERDAVLTFEDDAALGRFLSRAAPPESGLTLISRRDALRSERVRLDWADALPRDLAENSADYSALGANALFGIPHPPAKQDRAAVDQVPFGNDTLAVIGATGDRSAWNCGTTIAILDTGTASDATFGAAIVALAAGVSPDAGGGAPDVNLLSIRLTNARRAELKKLEASYKDLEDRCCPPDEAIMREKVWKPVRPAPTAQTGP